MPIRLKITLLFALIVLGILTLVCGSVYYFSYSNRIKNIKTRLTNRAISTGRLLNQSEIFDHSLMQRIDSSRALALKNKTVQVYDTTGKIIYAYSDVITDTLPVNSEILRATMKNEELYYDAGQRDVVGYYHQNGAKMIVMLAAFDEEGTNNLSRLKMILGFSFLGGILFALAAGYFFSEGLLRPIRKIADEVNEISARSLTRRINTGDNKDEWSYLSTTLNQLLNRLQDSFEMQQRFISNASHELSTPLTSISSQLEVSLQRPRDASEYYDVMKSIYQDVRQMSSLTQTLLTFAKASGTASGLEIDLIRIDEVLMRLPAEIKKIDQLYAVELNFNDLPEDEEKLLVFGNGELLFTAIKNVVINACKYSDEHIAFIKLIIDQANIVVCVKDKGAGIPSIEIQEIFQPFYRVDDHRAVAGFGLGLSLANRIIKLHKGTIEVESILGKGSSFTMSLPWAISKAEGFEV